MWDIEGLPAAANSSGEQVGSEIARELRRRRVHPSHKAVAKSSDLNKWFWRCGEMRMCFPLALETCRSLAGVLLFSVQ
ncbi:hypothetical protein AVEN_52560-1, partial [Araneus ventricosus]